jgi:two-component system, cell cycle response regulator CpdR
MGMRILVAEDSPTFVLLYKNSLEKRGHKVTIARDGNDCIYKYSDALDQQENGKNGSPYDLVILDHQMPRMQGTQVAKEILELNPKQRILFVTGHTKEMMKGVKALGEKIELLQKPFPTMAMIRQVEGLTRFRWLQRILGRGGLQEWDGEAGLSEPI